MPLHLLLRSAYLSRFTAASLASIVVRGSQGRLAEIELSTAASQRIETTLVL